MSCKNPKNKILVSGQLIDPESKQIFTVVDPSISLSRITEADRSYYEFFIRLHLINSDGTETITTNSIYFEEGQCKLTRK